MNKKIISLLVAGGLISLVGCSTNQYKTEEERGTEKNVITAAAAIGGMLAANALGVDNNIGKVAVGAITGFTARAVYDEVNKGTASDPNTTVTPVQIDGQQYIQVEVRNVNFQSGSANLAPSELGRLLPIIQTMTSHPNTKVHIEGHTDSDGSNQFNQQLSESRARNVSFYLMDNGISRDRIVTYGYGEERPIASNSTPEGKRENRRVTFLISEK